MSYQSSQQSASPKHGTTCPGAAYRVQYLPSSLSRYNNDHHGTEYRVDKPIAAVQPTTTPPSPTFLSFKPSEKRSQSVQVDETGIDVDLLLHVEDMVRTQQSLVLPKSFSVSDLVHQQPSSNPPTSLIACLEENARLREALSIQTKVNQDLKRLVVGAVSGDGELAERLVGISTAEVAHARLLEAAEGAGIAADIWRAKCLAGRVVASTAGRRAREHAKRAGHARHALAHLLGERARLRTSLVEAAEALINEKSASSQHLSGGTYLEPFTVRDTLALANLCQQLALGQVPLHQSGKVKVTCTKDTPGERLALEILINGSPDEGVLHDYAEDEVFHLHQPKKDHAGLSFDVSTSTAPDLPPSPPEEKDESFVAEVLAQFAATKRLDAEEMCLSCCSRCHGDIFIV